MLVCARAQVFATAVSVIYNSPRSSRLVMSRQLLSVIVAGLVVSWYPHAPSLQSRVCTYAHVCMRKCKHARVKSGANTFVSTTPHPHMKRRFCFSTETHSLERVIATPRRATPSDAVLQLRARNRVCNRVRTVTIPIRAG